MKASIRRKATYAGLGTAGVLALGLTVPGLAYAQDPSASPSPSASTGATTKPDRAAKQAERQDELAEALAKELGIDKAKVAAALDKIETEREANRPTPDPATAKPDRTAELKQRLAAAVTAGTITQAEADAIAKAAEAGVLAGGHGKPGR